MARKNKNKGKQFVVFGLGRFGKTVAETLEDSGCEVLAIDVCKERIQEMAETVTRAVQADVSDLETLETLGLRNFDGAIIAIGDNLEASVMATILVKELGVPYVLAKAKSEIHSKILKRVGADAVVLPEMEMGIRIANKILMGNFFDAVELSTTSSMMELDTPREWVGKNLIELDLRKRYEVNVVAIKHEGKLNISPHPTKTLIEDDILIVIGNNETLNELASYDSAKNNS